MKVINVHVVALPLVAWGLARLVEGAAPRLRLAAVSHELPSLQLDMQGPADLCLLDLDFWPQEDPVAVLRRGTAAPVLALTGSADSRVRERAVLSGARGLLNKHDSHEQALAAIEAVHAGHAWMDPATMGRALEVLTGQAAAPRPGQPGAADLRGLTRREREAVVVLARHPEASGRQLAALLGISEATLRNQLATIYSKLGLHSRVQLFAFAHAHGLHGEAGTRAAPGATRDNSLVK